MKLFYIILSAVLLAVFLWVASIGVAKQEASECQKWLKEAEIYEDYYLQSWQIKQCQNYQRSANNK